MSIVVKLPETALTAAGIGSGFFQCSLSKVNNLKARKKCRLFTQNFQKIKQAGFGICLFGEKEAVAYIGEHHNVIISNGMTDEIKKRLGEIK